MLKILLQGLFPVQCIICKLPGQWLCTEHQSLSPAPPNQVRYRHLDAIWAVTAYQDPSVKQIIEYFKFKHFRQLAKPMAQMMKQSLSEDFWRSATIIPIPLHWRRQLWRGFNQSERIAQNLPGPINGHLRRHKYTHQQARLSKVERLLNIKGAFKWDGGKAPKKVILIDDVVASGQTLEEAARVCKEAGVQEVVAVVFARGG